MNVKNVYYDLVIRYRYDLFTNEPVIFKNDLKHIHAMGRDQKLTDWIFYGNHVNMNHFMNIYSNLMEHKIKPHDVERMFQQNGNILCSIKDTFVIKHENHL